MIFLLIIFSGSRSGLNCWNSGFGVPASGSELAISDFPNPEASGSQPHTGIICRIHCVLADLLDSEGFVHFKIERFSKFLWQDWSAIKATKISSEPILIKGLSWKLIVRFFYYNKDEFCDPWHLGIFVQCDGEPGE